MKINTTTTVDLDSKEIDILMKAQQVLGRIANFAEAHKNELPEPAKNMGNLADETREKVRWFLEWMCVDLDDLDWNYDPEDPDQ